MDERAAVVPVLGPRGVQVSETSFYTRSSYPAAGRRSLYLVEVDHTCISTSLKHPVVATGATIASHFSPSHATTHHHVLHSIRIPPQLLYRCTTHGASDRRIADSHGPPQPRERHLPGRHTRLVRRPALLMKLLVTSLRTCMLVLTYIQ